MRSWKSTPIRIAGWHRDDKDRLILLRIPDQVCPGTSSSVHAYWNPKLIPLYLRAQIPLDPPPPSSFPSSAYCEQQHTTIDIHEHKPPTSSKIRTPNLTTLPPEIIHCIADDLHPVDRVCLALTCKPLASAILSAPLLCPTSWSRFSDQRYDWLLPESYSLILRLAHGWIPKDKLRYCWKCHKILPRNQDYFRKRLGPCRKNPKWSTKLGVDKNKWENMRRKEKYTYLVETWCESPLEDSSSLYCDFCRDRVLEEAPRFGVEGVGATLQHPVQCPLCLERELTYVWRPPRKPWIRAKVLKVLRILCRPLDRIAMYATAFIVVGGQLVCDLCMAAWEYTRALKIFNC
ncbi:hypothetical protein LTR67_001755 [Exophiala xenobiotica]